VLSGHDSDSSTEDKFYGYMVERERVRIRREVLALPRAEWTDDRVLREIRLTNVRREDDRTTRVLRELSKGTFDRWHALGQPGAQPWNQEQREFGGLLVFNYALWRAFGTGDLARRLGFLDVKTWDEATQARVVEAALFNWRRGVPCFTDAYNPARTNRGKELQCADDVCRVTVLYKKVCQQLTAVWKRRLQVAAAAESTRSWEQTTRALMEVSGYGGTGFSAKEIVQDLLHTPLFNEWRAEEGQWRGVCSDVNSWCAVGPGARRGLNRLHGRDTRRNANSTKSSCHDTFLNELLQLWSKRREHWPDSILGEPVADLELHDVQFQLCEFDKYERVRLGEGKGRTYVPRPEGTADCMKDDE